jgi:hypothetical protein
MSRIKHLETRVITVFGLEDDEGNIVQQYIIQANPKELNDPLLIKKFKQENLIVAYEAIMKIREELEKNHANN